MTSVQKAANLRYIATKVYTEQQHRDRLLLATRGRHRLSQTPVSTGQRVWIWRRPLKGRASDMKHCHAVDKPVCRKFVDCSKRKEAPPEEEPSAARVPQQIEQVPDEAVDEDEEYAPTEVVESAEEDDQGDPAVIPRDQDSWRQAGSRCWIRYHKAPRQHLFVPQGGMLERLIAEGFVHRKTIFIREHMDPHHLRDLWQEVGAKEAPFPWIGKTLFEKTEPTNKASARTKSSGSEFT
eukprot:5584454-Amphidinium_carterae.2